MYILLQEVRLLSSLMMLCLASTSYKTYQSYPPSNRPVALESYHNVINHFVLKLLAFLHWNTLQVFVTCSLVAAMHFIESFERAQTTIKSGAEWIKIVFPKQKQGKFTQK